MTRRQELMRAVQTETDNLATARAKLNAAERWLAASGTGYDLVVQATAIERGCFNRWLRASEELSTYKG
jgi:hypothetical protein